MTAPNLAGAPSRPVHRDRTWLTLDALNRDQAAHVVTLARHLARMHGGGVPGDDVLGGVVSGLRLEAAEPDAVRVTPGLAVDGAGTYLGLDAAVTVPVDDGTTVQVAIVSRDGGVALVVDDDAPPRWPSPRPVVLGSASRSGATVTPSPEHREQLVLTAQRVVAPQGGARVEIGRTPGRPGRVLAVRTADPAGGDEEVTAVTSDGSGRVAASVRASTRTSGPVMSAGGLTFGAPGPAPAAAAPWSVYRVTGEDGSDRLRAEIGAVVPGVDPATRELSLVVAGPSQTASAATKLRVDAAGTVTVQHSMTVAGTVTALGGAGVVGGAAGLDELAEDTGELLLRAQQVLARQADRDLTVVQVGAATVGAPGPGPVLLRYTFQLVSAPGAALRSVAAYETVLGGQGPVRRGFVAQDVDLAAGSARTVSREVDVSTAPAGAGVEVTVLAVAAGPDGQARSGTLVLRVTR